MVATAEHDNAWYVNDAYYNMFVKAMRLPVGRSGLYSVGTPYQGSGNVWVVSPDMKGKSPVANSAA